MDLNTILQIFYQYIICKSNDIFHTSTVFIIEFISIYSNEILHHLIEKNLLFSILFIKILVKVAKDVSICKMLYSYTTNPNLISNE
jgi:hemerythrin-like domain-containing protein